MQKIIIFSIFSSLDWKLYQVLHFALLPFRTNFYYFIFHWFSVTRQGNPVNYRAGDTGGGTGRGGAMSPPAFLRSKKKKGKQRENRKTFKAATIKRLSPRLKCYCFRQSRASRIQADNIRQCSMASLV